MALLILHFALAAWLQRREAAAERRGASRSVGGVAAAGTGLARLRAETAYRGRRVERRRRHEARRRGWNCNKEDESELSLLKAAQLHTAALGEMIQIEDVQPTMLHFNM